MLAVDFAVHESIASIGEEARTYGLENYNVHRFPSYLEIVKYIIKDLSIASMLIAAFKLIVMELGAHP